MELFSIFKRNKEVREQPRQEEKTYDIRYGMFENGDMQIEFEDKRPKVGQTYDTTRLVISKNPFRLANDAIVANAKVSWYDSNAMMWNGQSETMDAGIYTGVWAEVNYDLLQRDENYCVSVMKELLDKNRVTKFIENGMKDYPETPCGKYIGGVGVTRDGEYCPTFSGYVGQLAHNTPLMINRRSEHKAKMQAEANKQGRIAEKQAEIDRLRREIDDINGAGR